ncbi:MAG: CAAX prenyl protease-related protein, partial [Nitrospirae bacterium]
PWLPYAGPFLCFALFTYAGGRWPEAAHLWYAAKTGVVALLLAWAAPRIPELTWRAPVADWGLGVAVGLAVLAVWVLPERPLAPLMLGTPEGFDPYRFGLSPVATWGVIAVRIAGAALVVPVMEELFWRAFLMRYLVRPDFRELPLGHYHPFAFFAVAVAFGFEHHRWLVGIAAGLAYGGLVVWRKRLWPAILAHGVTNLGLGLYVVATRQWGFW